MEGDYVVLQYYSKSKVFEEEKYVSLMVCLEEKSELDWLFDFWDDGDKCSIRQKMEDMNDMK